MHCKFDLVNYSLTTDKILFNCTHESQYSRSFWGWSWNLWNICRGLEILILQLMTFTGIYKKSPFLISIDVSEGIIVIDSLENGSLWLNDRLSDSKCSVNSGISQYWIFHLILMNICTYFFTCILAKRYFLQNNQCLKTYFNLLIVILSILIYIHIISYRYIQTQVYCVTET